MREEEVDHPGPAQVTCGVCNQTMVPMFVPDSVYPSLGHFACIYCGSMVRYEKSPHDAPVPSSRKPWYTIMVVVLIVLIVAAVVADCAISS